ncbi:LOG family protein [Patescibacteria group bacterium]|nr:LOG family protein [Patescibacteria group bacterium]MCG2702638.1 LOG family protein [Candidatus Parcubacteria bacterium]MBU4265468.1 LOG family protein [Patescibacteria group bacterium]MBU4390518.1 LOG family protein [Patescibacteria group bacterium]MBU4397014.1 LOG family protein [Patescibacteria group bacterium]
MIGKTTKKIKRVAFFGDAEAGKKSRHFKDAFEVALLLAENGYIIVNGGGPGVMLASTLGAKSAGGKVETVIWEKKKTTTEFEGELIDNTSLSDKKYVEKSYEDRVEKLIDIADAYVIFKGGTGTISELGMVWGLAKLNYGYHEPIVFYGNFWRKIINSIVEKLVITSKEKMVYEIADSPKKVLDVLKKV